MSTYKPKEYTPEEKCPLRQAAMGIKPKGNFYQAMCAPADWFESAHDENWYPCWFKVVNDWGTAEVVSDAEAKAHFASLGQEMPEPLTRAAERKARGYR